MACTERIDKIISALYAKKEIIYQFVPLHPAWISNWNYNWIRRCSRDPGLRLPSVRDRNY